MAERLGAFKEETAKLVLEVVAYMQAAGFISASGRKSPPTFSTNPIIFRNDNGNTAIRYACMQAIGTEEVDGRNYVLVDRPVDTDGSAGPFLFNTHNEVPAGEFGVATAGPMVRAIASGSVSGAGAIYTPSIGSWEIQESEDGFRINVIGSDALDTNCVRGIVAPGIGSTPQNFNMFVTPPGGIPARVGSQVSKAQCDKYYINASTGQVVLFSAENVWHIGSSAVNGNTVIAAEQMLDESSGQMEWVAVLEDCGPGATYGVP